MYQDALQEALMHKPFIELPWNHLYFEPESYDIIGQTKSPAFFIPEVETKLTLLKLQMWFGMKR
jgi:hypothetical protein